MRLNNIRLSREYCPALGRGAVVVSLFVAIAGLVLDYGVTAQITLMAVLAYLGGVTVMVVRRPQTPTATDLLLLQYGFIPLWFITQISTRFVWSWRGLL